MVRIVAPPGITSGQFHLTHGDNQFWVLVDGNRKDFGESDGDRPLNRRPVDFEIPRHGSVRVTAILNNYEDNAHMAGHLMLGGDVVAPFDVRYNWPVRGICHVEEFVIARNMLEPPSQGTVRFACKSNLESRNCPQQPATPDHDVYGCEVELCTDGSETFDGTFLIEGGRRRLEEFDCQLLKADGAFDLEFAVLKVKPYDLSQPDKRQQVLIRYLNRGPAQPKSGDVVARCQLFFARG